MIDAINRHNAHGPLDLVMCSDVEGLCLLADIRGEIEPAPFPMSPRAVLERLNNKWAFRTLCDKLQLNAPPTLFFSRGTALDVDRVSDEIGLPAVVKPVAKWASIGMRIVGSAGALRDVVSDVECQGEDVVVQKFIRGRDVGMGLFARDGRVVASCTFFCGERDAAEFADMPSFRRIGAAIVRSTSFTGIANFDARFDEAGRFWLLECNPRFFMRLGAARMCGLDLLKLGLPGEQAGIVPTASGSYHPRSDILSRSGIRRALRRRSSALVLMQGVMEAMADPLPLLLRRFGEDQIQRNFFYRNSRSRDAPLGNSVARRSEKL